jgi:hypothetical protein
VQQQRDGSGPAGLVRCIATTSRIDVEVFMEQQVVVKVEILLLLHAVAEIRPPSITVAQEERDQPRAVRPLSRPDRAAGPTGPKL